MRSLSTTCTKFLLWMVIPQAMAHANPGIPYGWGEKIIHVEDLQPDVQAELKSITNQDLAVGFIYGHRYFFHENFDLWTWGGRLVLFSGEQYWELPDEALADILGKEKFAAWSKPIYYRFPRGLTFLIGIACAIMAFIRLVPTAGARVRKLMRDVSYREALEVYCANLPTESEPDREDKTEAMAAALAYLRTTALPPRLAEANFRFLIGESERARSYQLRHQALAHEEAGEWEQAIEHYQQAADLREEWDAKDYQFLLKCIERVQRQQARQRKD